MGTENPQDSVRTRIKHWIAEIDRKLSAQLVEIMHHPDFQRLEATWRGLHYLVNQTETSPNLKICVLSVSKGELVEDPQRGVAFDRSVLFEKVYEEVYDQPRGEPYGLLVGDYEFGRDPLDITLLEMISDVAAAAHAPFIAGASPKLFNVDRFTELTAARDLAKVFKRVEYAAWNSFRESEDSRYVALTLPRVLGRLPYGENFQHISEFNFEEFATGPDQHKFLWMNAAWAYAARATDAFAKYGWFARTRGVEGGGKVEGLPAHSFPTDDGDVAMKCSTEVAISVRREFELSNLGFLPLLHDENRDFAVFLGAQSCQKPKQHFDPGANANAELSAKVNYVLCVSRFAHYVKVMARDTINSFKRVEDCERWLNEWINNYVIANTEMVSDKAKAEKPLADARVEVREVKGKPGRYEAVTWLRPQFQLEPLTTSMRLIAEVPKKCDKAPQTGVQTSDKITLPPELLECTKQFRKGDRERGGKDFIVNFLGPVAKADVEASIKRWISLIDAVLFVQRADAAAPRKELLDARERLTMLLSQVEGVDKLEQLLTELLSICGQTTQLLGEIGVEPAPKEKTPLGDEEKQSIRGSVADEVPQIIRRHTDISFPAQVAVSKTYNLRVQLVPAEEILPTGELQQLPRPHAHDVTMSLQVPQPAKPEEAPPPIRVTVSVATENFVIEGNLRADIVVPLVGKSPGVQFRLRGQEIGPGRIMVDFAQDGRPVGSVDLSTEVVPIDQKPTLEQACTAGEVNLRLPPGPAPDVVIKVFEYRLADQPGHLRFHLFSTHPKLQDLPVLDGDLGTQDLRSDVGAWVESRLRIVGAVARQLDATAAQVDKALADVGYQLYEQLLPAKLQELCWTLRQRDVKTVLILSDEPHIPWELIKPYRADPASGQFEQVDGFWGETFALTHWLRGRPPAQQLSLRRVLAMAAGATKASGSREAARDMLLASPEAASSDELSPLPANANLKCADEEINILRSLETAGAQLKVLPARRQLLYEAFERAEFDLLHLACHGNFAGLSGADASAVLMEDGVFSAAELSPRMACALRAAAPLIFFNACQSGRLGFSLTGLGSWGARLVQLGCGGFIGSLWPVTDKAALAFAQAFYELVASGLPLGEAVLQARQRAHEQHPQDPSGLAYCCFADPMARVENTASKSSIS
jgi:type VI secretion system protein ImpC